MTKRFPLYLTIALLISCFTAGCNDDTSDMAVLEGDYYNCSISSFSLSKDDSVLRALDSVFFSIDLINAEIYNADSLPKGTDIRKLVVNVNAAAASSIEVTYKALVSKRDTTVNLTEHPGDSINFSDGPVEMTVTSYNGQAKLKYNIRVNVHTMVSDTLYWDQLQRVDFPKSARAQKTVMYADKPHTMLEGTDGTFYLCTTSSPEIESWSTVIPSLPSGADINSFAATTDALYITDAQGHLYTSTDGLTWSATSAVMDCVYGGYGTTLLGARKDGNTWKQVSYPASAERALPAGCPVKGTSQLVIYETKWSDNPMAIMIGGQDSAGRYTGEAWAYDGTIWDRVSTTGIDERAGVTLLPYLTPRIAANSWRVTNQSALLAMGGYYENENGKVTAKHVYISYDFGITWKEADTYLQFPSSYPAFSMAQALVIDYTLSSRSSAGGNWADIPVNGIPAWATPLDRNSGMASRIDKPVTSWECPYIFLFGGTAADGSLIPGVTRGVINRFTFKPIY